MPEKSLQELLAELSQASPVMEVLVNDLGPSRAVLSELEIMGAGEHVLREYAAPLAQEWDLRLQQDADAEQTARAIRLLNSLYCHQVASHREATEKLWETLLAMSGSTEHPFVLEHILEKIGIAAVLLGPEAARQAAHLPFHPEGIRRAVKGLAESDRAELEAACAWFDEDPSTVSQGTSSMYRIVRFRLGKALEAMGVSGALDALHRPWPRRRRRAA